MFAPAHLTDPDRLKSETEQPVLRAAGNGDLRRFVLPLLAGNDNNHRMRNSDKILAPILAALKAGG